MSADLEWTEDSRSAISAEGAEVHCNYLDHELFDASQNLSVTLHMAFLSYASTRTTGSAYSLRIAINRFLDYLLYLSNKAPTAFIPSHVTELTAPIFRGFIEHLRNNSLPITSAGILKSALSFLSREYHQVPFLRLPKVPSTQFNTTPPLNNETQNSLIKTLKSNIDMLYRKISERSRLDKVAPYTYEELKPLIEKNYTKIEILIWIKYHETNNLKCSRYKLNSRVIRCNDPTISTDISSPTQGLIHLKTYETLNGTLEIPPDYDPEMGLKENIFNWTPDPDRILKTFISNDFPFKYSTEELIQSYSRTNITRINECSDVLQIIIYRLCHVPKFFKNKYPNSDQGMDVSETIYLYYPSQDDMVNIVLMAMFNTGWNQETIYALDRNNFEHPLSGMLEPASRVIWSVKNRGSHSRKVQNKAPHQPKEITTVSNANNPYSLYNLILLAKELSSPLMDYPCVLDLKAGCSKLFCYATKFYSWRTATISSLDRVGRTSTAVNTFLNRHNIIEDGERISRCVDFSRRLRPTWVQSKKNKLSDDFISHLMGHATDSTTDVYYDSSPAAQANRFSRLRTELEAVLELLRARKFSGLLSKHVEKKASQPLYAFHIPGLERAIWACTDRKDPDWVGSSAFDFQSEPCTRLDKCLFCSRVRILEDSLPFLLERRGHVEEMLNDANYKSEFSSLDNERDVIDQILENWNDSISIRDAARYRKKNGPLLPRNLAELSLIFKSRSIE